MSIIKFIHVRHGQAKNKKLTLLGKLQARRVVKELYDENIQIVYCSPEERTRKTAEIIAKKLGLSSPISDARLDERKGLTHKASTKEELEFADNYLNPRYECTEPEGCKNFLDRTFSFFDEVKSKGFESVLIVGHSSLSYALAAYFSGIREGQDIAWLRIGNCSKVAYSTNDKRGHIKTPETQD